MSDDDEALSLSEMPGAKGKIKKRRLSFDKLLKNKYINYTEEELVQINDNRKDEILEMDEKNKKAKEELTKAIEKLNALITSNSEILFQDQKKNMTEIENLEKIFYLRKHDHTLSLKYNTTFKKQYNALKIKAKNMGDEEKISQKILNDRNNLEKLKNENFDLNKQIQKYELSTVKQKKQLENLNFNQKPENNLQNFANILNQSSLTLFKYHDKIENKKKTINNLKEEFNNLNKYIQKNKNKIDDSDKGEDAINKINTDLELLKNDLTKKVDEIIQNCYDNKTSIPLIREDNDIKTENNQYTTLNKSSSVKNFQIYTNSKKLRPIKYIGRSQSSLFKISTENSLTKKNINILSSNNILNQKNLSIFTKFKILKTTKPIKLGSSSSFNPTAQNVSMFVTKEVIDFNKKTYEDEELEKEIKKIDQNDYQQLIDLKGNYVDINDRLLNDIKEKKKIYYNRIKQLTICVENNMEKLKQIKEANDIMKKNLEAFEQKIKDKMKKIKAKKEEEKILYKNSNNNLMEINNDIDNENINDDVNKNQNDNENVEE